MLDLFVEFVALVAHGEPVRTANRGNPHWLPDGKYGWNGNLFTGLYREPKGTTAQNQRGPFTVRRNGKGPEPPPSVLAELGHSQIQNRPLPNPGGNPGKVVKIDQV